MGFLTSSSDSSSESVSYSLDSSSPALAAKAAASSSSSSSLSSSSEDSSKKGLLSAHVFLTREQQSGLSRKQDTHLLHPHHPLSSRPAHSPNPSSSRLPSLPLPLLSQFLLHP